MLSLSSLRIHNFRNFIDSGDIPYHDMTIFVGENGSGKTSTIDALSLLLNYDGHKPLLAEAIDSTLPIKIEAKFDVLPAGIERSIDKYLRDDMLTVQYSYWTDTGATLYEILCEKYVDERFNNFRSLNAAALKDFVRELNEIARRTMSENYALIERYLSTTQHKNFWDIQQYNGKR